MLSLVSYCGQINQRYATLPCIYATRPPIGELILTAALISILIYIYVTNFLYSFILNTVLNDAVYRPIHVICHTEIVWKLQRHDWAAESAQDSVFTQLNCFLCCAKVPNFESMSHVCASQVICLSSTVVWWLAQLPHSSKDLDSNPGWGLSVCCLRKTAKLHMKWGFFF